MHRGLGAAGLLGEGPSSWPDCEKPPHQGQAPLVLALATWWLRLPSGWAVGSGLPTPAGHCRPHLPVAPWPVSKCSGPPTRGPCTLPWFSPAQPEPSGTPLVEQDTCCQQGAALGRASASPPPAPQTQWRGQGGEDPQRLPRGLSSRPTPHICTSPCCMAGREPSSSHRQGFPPRGPHTRALPPPRPPGPDQAVQGRALDGPAAFPCRDLRGPRRVHKSCLACPLPLAARSSVASGRLLTAWVRG